MGIIINSNVISENSYSKNEINEKIAEINSDIDSKADKSTTLSGYGITDGLGYNNISDCILNIPQNIIYEISEDKTTITIKSGSLIYNPDGTSFSLSQDKSVTMTQYNGTRTLFVNNVSYGIANIDNLGLWSSDTEPQVTYFQAHNYWYNPLEKFIKHTADKGLSWDDPNFSLPIAVCVVENNLVKKVVPFNGIGFCGATLFSLPGILVASPNGRNSDGTLKNNVLKQDSINTYTMQSFDRTQVWVNNLAIIAVAEGAYVYRESDNILIAKGYDLGPRSYTYVGNIKNDGIRINDYEPRYTLKVTDFFEYKSLFGLSDDGKQKISEFSSPSSKYDDIELQASETLYTAPGNGYFTICKPVLNTNEYIYMVNTTSSLNINNYTPHVDNQVRCFIPAKKGDKVRVGYTASGTLVYFRFVYMEGDV